MDENVTGEIGATACTLEYKWVIDYERITSKKTGEVLKSPVFKTVNMGNFCDWQIWLYPCGRLEDYKDYFSIYLYLLSNDELKVADISFATINNIDNKVVMKQKTGEYTFHPASNGFGLSKLVKRDVIERNNTVEGDGKFTIACELIVQKNEEQKNILSMEVNQDLIADFEQLIDDKEFSDVHFMFGDKELRAHKSVLSKRSAVFAAMFRNEMREKHENEVEITDVRHEVFLEMLRYMYAEKVNGIKKIAGELLAAADKYSLDGLKLMCEKSLRNVKADNVLETLRLADRHSAEGLKAKCIEFIVTKAASIVDEPEFRQLPSNIICDVCSAALADKKT